MSFRLRTAQGKLKIEHSILENLRPVLDRLVLREEIRSIIPGVIRPVRDAKGVVTRLKIDRAEAAFIEKLDADQGASVEFNQVLLVGAGSSVTIGAPYVGTAKVVATVESHGKGDKVRIVK